MALTSGWGGSRVSGNASWSYSFSVSWLCFLWGYFHFRQGRHCLPVALAWHPTASPTQGRVSHCFEILGRVCKPELSLKLFLDIISEIRGRNIKYAMVGSGLRHRWVPGPAGCRYGCQSAPLTTWAEQRAQRQPGTREGRLGWQSPRCPLVVLVTHQHVFLNDSKDPLGNPWKIPSLLSRKTKQS